MLRLELHGGFRKVGSVESGFTMDVFSGYQGRTSGWNIPGRPLFRVCLRVRIMPWRFARLGLGDIAGNSNDAEQVQLFRRSWASRIPIASS